MKYMSSEKIRNIWVDFWKSKGHSIEPSANLIPKDDKTLLWINSGVAALKKYFDGSVTPKNRRIANVQKSIRTNDIENVGMTARHHTFFEMLGNFSIGDYFREDVLPWAYELLFDEKWFGFDKEKIYFTTYKYDYDTINLWKKLGVKEDHIIPLEGNFWEIGEGPCGPDTEVFFDRGEAYDPNNMGVRLLQEDIDNDRYIEIWNIVFSQYNAKEGIKREDYKELPYKNIDTGAGFERFCLVIQGAETNYETDLFMPIINEVKKYTKYPYEGDYKFAYKVIADHIRSCTFALADGAMFSNEGRGYVLRRIIRRAIRYAKKLDINEAFMYKLVPIVRDIMKSYYPELVSKCDYVSELVKIEEEKFKQTLTQGENMLKDILNNISNDVLSGENAFKLYDTYGFPIELTVEIANEFNKKVDLEGFKKELDKQKERARNSREDIQSMKGQHKDLLDCKVNSEFTYDSNSVETRVVALFKEYSKCDSLDGLGQVILEVTPFYAEMGGQVGDIGYIENDNFKGIVTNVIKAPNGQHLHVIEVKEGCLKLNDSVKAYIDVTRREYIRRNHSCAHLLQAALKEVLGNHILQAGSYVDENRVRFDFTHFKKIDEKELELIESKVNEAIFKGYDVDTKVMSVDEARDSGAIALFDDKYGEKVRVVSMGEYSKELCGGTHVRNTLDIGLFVIKSEESISSGVRRIEGATSKNAYAILKDREHILKRVSLSLKNPSIYTVEEKLNSFLNELDLQKQEINNLKTKIANVKVEELLNNSKNIGYSKVMISSVDNMGMSELNLIASGIKNRCNDYFLFLVSNSDNKLSMVCQLSKSFIDKGVLAGNVVKQAAMLAGGNGGGRNDFASAGAKDISKVNEIISYVNTLVEE